MPKQIRNSAKNLGEVALNRHSSYELRIGVPLASHSTPEKVGFLGLAVLLFLLA